MKLTLPPLIKQLPISIKYAETSQHFTTYLPPLILTKKPHFKKHKTIRRFAQGYYHKYINYIYFHNPSFYYSIYFSGSNNYLKFQQYSNTNFKLIFEPDALDKPAITPSILVDFNLL